MAQPQQANGQKPFWDRQEEVAVLHKTDSSWYSFRIGYREGSEPYVIVQELYKTRYDPTPKPSTARISFPVRMLPDVIAHLERTGEEIKA